MPPAAAHANISPLIVPRSLLLHRHLEPDLLHNAHQQGVHVVVQSCTHLNILAVVGNSKGTSLWKAFQSSINWFFSSNFLFITLTWYDPRPDEVCLVAHQDDGLVAGHVPDLAEVVKDCLGCGKTCLLG